MTLREQRCLFTSLVARLILLVEMMPGYELALSEVKRSQAQANANAAAGTGISNSLHLDSLAADFDLYINGAYQPASSAHEPIGKLWKSLHPLCRWGGDFKPSPDGNHYSTEWQGRK
jgi:hypothetical protein